MRLAMKDHERCAVLSGVTAFLFAICMVFGQGLNKNGEIPVKNISSWVALAALFLLTFYVLFWFLVKVETGKISFPVGEDIQTDTAKEKRILGIKKEYLITWGAFVLCYLPSLLAVYPGFFLYDAQDEYVEVATRTFTTHHPLLHVLTLGGTICGVHKITGSYNLGIFAYMLFQIVVIAACFTYLLAFMKKKGMAKKYRIITFLYLAFFPANVMFVLCSAKDTLFAAMLLVCVLLCLDLFVYRNGENEKKNDKSLFLLIGFSTLTMLYRNNAVYAFVVFALFLLVVKRKEAKKIVVFFAAAVILYFVVSKGMAAILHAPASGHQEILTVPIQQISRAYRADKSQFSEADTEKLFSYIPEEALNRYTPKLSDPVKVHFDNLAYEKDSKGFLDLWLKTFVRNPIGYANAWFMTSYGYWYPDAEVDVYEGHVVFTHSYENSSYFGFETELPGERNSKFPLLEKLFEEISLEDIVQEIPVISWMFSMGALFWLYVLGAVVLTVKGEKKHLIPFAFPTLVWMTLLLGPTYLPRYVVFMWFILPLFAGEVLFTGRESK